MTMRGRRLASASRLASGVVRSRIRTPSRWSASCWATREYGSSSSYRNLGSVLVPALDHDRRRPLDREEDALDREAALVLESRHLAALHDLRVRERDGLVLGDLEDEQPLQHADLRRREPDPVGVDHELLHPLDEAPQVVVELLDRARGHLQRRVRVLADLRERQPSSRLLLGVELLVLDLSLDLRHRAGLYPRGRGSQDAAGDHGPGRDAAGDAPGAP